MNRKNKTRIKRIRTEARIITKNVWYVKWLLHWRPKMQKLFFPICALVLLIGILDYERNERGTIIIENAAAAQVGNQAQDQAHVRSDEAQMEDGTSHGQNPVSVVSETEADTHAFHAITPETIEAKIRQAFPGEEDTAVAVAMCESRLDPKRIGDTDFHKPSVGLFQINQFYHPYSTKELQDADRNIAIAKEIKNRWGNWNAWSCHKFGYYEKYL